jgi:hypothetical protein
MVSWFLVFEENPKTQPPRTLTTSRAAAENAKILDQPPDWCFQFGGELSIAVPAALGSATRFSGDAGCFIFSQSNLNFTA